MPPPAAPGDGQAPYHQFSTRSRQIATACKRAAPLNSSSTWQSKAGCSPPPSSVRPSLHCWPAGSCWPSPHRQRQERSPSCCPWWPCCSSGSSKVGPRWPAAPKALLLSPTHELAAQTTRVLKLLLPGSGLRCCLLSKQSAGGTNWGRGGRAGGQPPEAQGAAGAGQGGPQPGEQDISGGAVPGTGGLLPAYQH